MIVTIEEIEKGMWCPDARVRAQGGARDAPGNRFVDKGKIKADSAKAFCCIGPLCMAWRWHKADISGWCGRAGLPKEATVLSEAPKKK